MRGLAFLALTCAAIFGGLVTATASDAPVPPEFEVADRLMPTDPMPDRETRWAEADVTLTDVLYATLPGFRPLRLDLYRKAGDSRALPLVVFVHGGGWAHANPRAGAAFSNLPSVLASLARRGYVVASIEFRQSGEAPFPAQLEDLRAALRFLHGNAPRYGIDTAHVGLWGMSSGAHLAALGAFDCTESSCLQGFVGWFGVYDLVRYQRETPDRAPLRALLRCAADGCSSAALQRASPSTYVDGHDPPALLVHGGTDSNVAPGQTTSFASQLRAAGVPAEVLMIPGVGHGLVGQSAAATNAASRAALAATFAFFDRVLRPGSEPVQGTP